MLHTSLASSELLSVTPVWHDMLSRLLHAPLHTTEAVVGGEHQPRGTYELLGQSISVPAFMDLGQSLVSSPARKLSTKFAIGEALWILSGSNLLSDILPFSRKMADYSDDGVHLFGAYGPKFREQLDGVVAAFKRDRGTRQAVVNIWREGVHSGPRSKDVPCTLSWQFLLRGGSLHLIVTMRSNDAWLGFPYDIFSTTVIKWWMCYHLTAALNTLVLPGATTHNVGSLHLYSDDAERAETVTAYPPSVGACLLPYEAGLSADQFVLQLSTILLALK